MTYIRNCILALLLFFTLGATAQNRLLVQGASPELYLVHTVIAKENWYSIGRIYNISPKEIAPFNGTTLDHALAIGEKLKIPLTAINFTQDGSRADDEVFIPLYHIVQEKEWMYRISAIHNKVAIENLEKWNNVKNDQLKPGMQLVVGYLKVKSAQSSLAAMGTRKIAMASTAPVVAVAEKPAETPAKTEPPAVTEPPAKQEEKNAGKPATREEDKAAETRPEESRPVEVQPVANAGTASHKGGAFRRLYSETGGGTAGNAGIFRSTSGWNDGKYYALMNNVPVGTIVKVSFSSTNKTIYAKVLGQLPDMKESVGLTIRISDAAASELGVSLSKFYVDVKY